MNSPAALHAAGLRALKRRDYPGALVVLQEAAALQRSPEILNHLGVALYGLRRDEEAVLHYREAIARNQRYAAAHTNLGLALTRLGRHDEAEASLRRAITEQPAAAEAHNNLANVYKDCGRLDEAMQHFRRAVEIRPGYLTAWSNLLLTMTYSPRVAPEEMAAEHHKVAQRLYAPAAEPPLRKPPAGRLRVGYVSADLRHTTVALFIGPILENHDRSAFEVYCYHNHAESDAVTRKLRTSSEHWRDVVALEDDELVRMIKADGIDLLVDLNGHSAGNRLGVFARRAAPVQVTYLGYLFTTGLTTMAYRLTDRHAEPEGMGDALYTERLYRLPECYWCYRPDDGLPAVSPSPALRNGYLTFGSLNNYAKVNDDVLALWAELLRAVPDSKLMVAAVPAGSTRATLRAHLENLGVAPQRVEMTGRTSNLHEFYARMDIALDTFPYGGGTTTCESLWMGIPVLSLVGSTFTSRMGYTLLRAAGLPEYAARSPQEYVDLVRGLGANRASLVATRRGLRESLSSSSLMRAADFTRQLEDAYRSMLSSLTTS